MNLKARLEGKLNSHLNIKKPEVEKLAAVLIAIGKNSTNNELRILMTKRASQVETHKNQISFPGGYQEATDKNLLSTALREAEEEVGIRKEQLEILGSLNPVNTHLSNILVFPFVALAEFPEKFKINPNEVEKIIFVPLDKFLYEGLKPVEVKVGPIKVKSIGIKMEDELIWGASARMLMDLRNRIYRGY